MRKKTINALLKIYYIICSCKNLEDYLKNKKKLLLKPVSKTLCFFYMENLRNMCFPVQKVQLISDSVC
jgi:hypothetical protein